MTLVPGALETSNVDLAKEFTNLVVAQRAFQANSRVITTARPGHAGTGQPGPLVTPRGTLRAGPGRRAARSRAGRRRRVKELKSMIKVTKLNGRELVVNADLIEFIETTPDTLISLTTGRKIMVLEDIDEVVTQGGRLPEPGRGSTRSRPAAPVRCSRAEALRERVRRRGDRAWTSRQSSVSSRPSV